MRLNRSSKVALGQDLCSDLGAESSCVIESPTGLYCFTSTGFQRTYYISLNARGEGAYLAVKQNSNVWEIFASDKG